MKLADRLLNIALFVVMGALGSITAYFASSYLIKSSYSQPADLPPPPPGAVPPPPPGTGTVPVPPLPGGNGAPPLPADADPNLTMPTADNGQITGDQQLLEFLEPFLYKTQDGRRDPFKEPTIDLTSTAGGPGGFQGPVLPLQRFDLGELKLTGILWDVKNPRAMFVDPSQKVHFVGKDQRIGRNNGYVAVIREGEVVVVETTRVNGELTYTTRILRIEGVKDDKAN